MFHHLCQTGCTHFRSRITSAPDDPVPYFCLIVVFHLPKPSGALHSIHNGHIDIEDDTVVRRSRTFLEFDEGLRPMSQMSAHHHTLADEASKTDQCL